MNAAFAHEGSFEQIRARRPTFPGASVGVRVSVYDSVAPDGKISGTPHVHLACNELYFVLAGSGGVELIDVDGFRMVELD